MPEPSEREAAILARCEPYAAQYIANLRGHPLYLEVLARLEKTPGKLFELDVERAFYDSLRADMTERRPLDQGRPDST